MRPSLRLGNALLLIALLATYVLPPGTIQRALADDPEPPTEGPLVGDFIEVAMATAHGRLFGAYAEDEQTAYYHTTEPIDAAGIYDGSSNVNDPCTVDVIRYIPYTENLPTGTNCGIMWAKVSTSMATVRLIGVAMAWDDIDPNTAGLQPDQGFVPIMLHGPLEGYYLSGNPTT
jgi:hypothetical protein